MRLLRVCLSIALLVGSVSALPERAAAEVRTFEAGSLLIPMDLSYQRTGMFQAYGLIYQLLRQGVHVAWVIDPAKTYHAAPCDTPGDLCPWDCEVQGSGVKCPYPTASPDLTATTSVVWSDTGAARGTALGAHGYRGGPFVIAAADREKALAIVEAWNDRARWTANPWARRSVFHVVSVHEATAPFSGNVAKQMVAAPTIAVFADGNEPIATGYLRAAGIPQSNGAEFPSGKCNDGGCGPGTANPDLLTEEAVAGDLGTCAAPNLDHKNGALFTAAGEPAYCQIMSMHWDVADRETVQCDGGDCPATRAECTNERFTYHGHEVVAEVRAFLQYPVHFFAQCQAVNAYENTTPNPAWPFLDDEGRDGHFLTTRGTPPPCPCADAGYQCVTGGCNGVDCCLAKDQKERGAGYEIAAQPASSTVKLLRPDVPYNQLDGAFGTTGGSEPAYNLSAFLGTTYKNNRQVTLLTGPNGPGNQDVWMSGYLDGACDVIEVAGEEEEAARSGDRPRAGRQPRAGECGKGKISYLGGHQYRTDVPVNSESQSQGTRLFLNALFEADCVTSKLPADRDGDGLPDDGDPFPDDATRCGDIDGDRCDDCASGHYDLDADCAGADGASAGGCCGAGGGNPAPAVLLGGLWLLGRRRRQR